jgi:hypothetical protein
MLYLAKFALDILLFKAMGGINKTKITVPIFYARVSFDALAITSIILYQYYKEAIMLG